MFFERRESRNNLDVVSTFPEALQLASWIVSRSNSCANIVIVDGCISLYTDGYLNQSENELMKDTFAHTFYKGYNQFWTPLSRSAFLEFPFSIGEDCLEQSMRFHAYLRFDSSKHKQWKASFDTLFPEYFGILCPKSNINLNISIDRSPRIKTVLVPFDKPRRIAGGGLLYVSDGKKALSSTMFELGIDSYGNDSVIVLDINDLSQDAELWQPVFELNPTEIEEYTFKPDEDFARKKNTHFSEFQFRDHFELFENVLKRVMDIVDKQFPDQQKAWASGVYSEESIKDSDHTNLMEVSTGIKNYKQYVIYSINVNYHGFKNPSFYLQFEILDAVITAVDKYLQLNSRAQLGSLCFQMGPFQAIEQLQFEQKFEQKFEPQSEQQFVDHAMPEDKIEERETPSKRKYSEKSGENFSTVQNAWNLITEIPILGHVSAEAKAKKLKTLLSSMRGNRFAKPPEGSAKRGGNNRDVSEKKVHVLREFMEASSYGITKDEFYDLMKAGGVLFTKSAAKKSRVSDEDDGRLD
jgi:hypothetical protein